MSVGEFLNKYPDIPPRELQQLASNPTFAPLTHPVPVDPTIPVSSCPSLYYPPTWLVAYLSLILATI